MAIIQETISQINFLPWKLFNWCSNLLTIRSHWSNKQEASVGSDNGLAPDRQQANVWTSIGLVYPSIHASPRLNKSKPLIRSCKTYYEKHWKVTVVVMPNLLSPAPPLVFGRTTCGTTRQSWHYDNSQFSVKNQETLNGVSVLRDLMRHIIKYHTWMTLALMYIWKLIQINLLTTLSILQYYVDVNTISSLQKLECIIDESNQCRRTCSTQFYFILIILTKRLIYHQHAQFIFRNIINIYSIFLTLIWCR